MDGGFWHWWWTYAMDGVIGGVLGGAATGAAVWWTIRHESHRANEASIEVLASRVRDMVTQISWEVMSRETLAEQRAKILELLALCTELNRRLKRHWPATAKALNDAATTFTRATTTSNVMGKTGSDADVVIVPLMKVGSVCQSWLGNPKTAERDFASGLLPWSEASE